jgi:hypothetical protein
MSNQFLMDQTKAADLVAELIIERNQVLDNLSLAPNPSLWEHGARIDLVLSRLVGPAGEESDAESK